MSGRCPERILLAIACVVLAGCSDTGDRVNPSGQLDQVAGAEAERWVHRPSSEQRSRFHNPLPNYLIAESQTEIALARLSAAPCALLTLEEARLLSGSQIELGDTVGVPVLLRMVRPRTSRSGEAQFDDVKVFWETGAVFVTYLATRHRDMPLNPAAVIAIVPSEPQEVFVEALTAIY